MKPDFNFAGHGSICLLHPLTPAASAWVKEHLPSDAQRLGNAVVIEPRYATDILDGIREAGLSLV